MPKMYKFMRYPFYYIPFICMISCFAFPCLGQDQTFQNISFRVGAGNSISIKQFSHEETSFNIPASSFVEVQASTNLFEKNNTSLFLGLEMQVLNYYPAFNEKANLTYISLLAGRTSRIEVTQGLQVKYTGGLSLGTLTDVSSSVSGYDSYSGSPVKNLNVGLFNNLQVLFGTGKKDKWVEYGLGFDVVVNGVPLYSNKSYPLYLKQNAFIQYGLSFNVNYHLKSRSAVR
jgi:hypothetical protein